MLNLENAKYYVKTNNQKVIILADEPDKNLHPFLQQQLADYLTYFAKNNPDIYLIITTHSPFLLKDLKNNFYITERTVNLTENCKKEGSTFFSHFKAKMPDKLNKFQNLYTLLVASELYSNDKSFFSSLSEKYIIYTNGDSSIDSELKNILNKMGINDIKIRPLNSISYSNKIFSSASICEYFSKITNINDVIKIIEKLEKGEIVLFQYKQKENLKETDSEMSIQSN